MINPVDAENGRILGLFEPSHARCTRALSIPERDVTAALTFLSKSYWGRGRISPIQPHFNLFKLITFIFRAANVFWKYEILSSKCGHMSF